MEINNARTNKQPRKSPVREPWSVCHPHHDDNDEESGVKSLQKIRNKN